VGSVQQLRERTQMPLTFTLEIAPAAREAAAAALARAAGAAPDATPAGLRLQCARERKMAVLAALAPFGTQVHDVKLTEPSLEDVFFGFSA